MTTTEILIQNLRNAAEWHKKNCHDENCNVSILYLKEIAQRYLNFETVYNDKFYDYDKCMKIINSWPI